MMQFTKSLDFNQIVAWLSPNQNVSLIGRYQPRFSHFLTLQMYLIYELQARHQRAALGNPEKGAV